MFATATGACLRIAAPVLAVITPNVSYNKALSKKVLEDDLSKLSYTRGTIDQGKLIIAKG